MPEFLRERVLMNIWTSEERKRLLDVFVAANAMAENYYADGIGEGHPSIQRYHRARDEFTEWLAAEIKVGLEIPE